MHSVLFAARDASGSPFRGADLELFFVLARQAVIAMENARLYEDLRAYVKQIEESQQALLRVEKMAAAGRLTASIAHEINNPLQSVQNCLHLAGHENVEPEKRKEYLELAQKELDRLSKTVRRMLDFYRPGAARYEQVDLLDLLNHVLSLTSAQLRSKNVTANIELPDSLPAIFAVSSQLQQIFFNLILNALDAMPEGGELSIRARAVTDGVEIMFEDSGPGIPEERRENIFEPFFSTKEGGTGLGLTVSYNIATAHGGTLDLIEGHGSGACFRLFLPMGDKQ
jgi:signal transduction histidine kinase